MRILLRRCRCRSISQLRLCGQTAAECECFFVHWPFCVWWSATANNNQTKSAVNLLCLIVLHRKFFPIISNINLNALLV